MDKQEDKRNFLNTKNAHLSLLKKEYGHKIKDGNFLTFVSQKEKGDLVKYTFINPKTKEIVELEEFY